MNAVVRVVATLLLASSSAAVAQTERTVPITTRMTAAERRAAVDTIATSFDTYVFPQKRDAIVARLRAADAAGRYDVDDPHAFADRVTADLRDVSGDGHLYLRVDAAGFAATRASADGARGPQGDSAYWRSKAIRNHHGLVETRILPGNVRYLRIAGFDWVTDETGSVYDAALRFLKDGDAVVVDVRRNRGGDHAAVRYLTSHFLGDETLLMTFLRGAEPPMQSWTLDHVPAGRLIGKPLYVLIDRRTGSAAEEFAYQVEQYRLGTLVGQRTVGAANNNRRLPVAPTFLLSVSEGRPEHPVSHGNWEGTGVAPAIETSPEQALDVALVDALRRLADGGGVDAAWALVAAQARLSPVVADASNLQRLAGRYGDLSITWRDDTLYVDRPERGVAVATRLTPLTDAGLFAIDGEPDTRLQLLNDTARLLRVGSGAGPLLPRR